MTDPLPTELEVEDLHALRQAGLPHRLIDCREPDEWHLCRIEGAALVPLGVFAERAPLQLPDKEEQVIVYCHHGVRSMRATLWLRQQGYEKAQSLRGGVDLWSEMIDANVPRY